MTTNTPITTKKFKFTNANLKSLPSNPTNSSSTELEVSDTEIIGLKCLSGKTGNKRFLLRYKFNGRKCSMTIGRFPDININQARKYKDMIADGVDPKAERDNQVDHPTVNHSSTIPTYHWKNVERKHGVLMKNDFVNTVMRLPILANG